jgi:hypothetical protein
MIAVGAQAMFARWLPLCVKTMLSSKVNIDKVAIALMTAILLRDDPVCAAGKPPALD